MKHKQNIEDYCQEPFKEMGTHNGMDLILKGHIKQKRNVFLAQKYGSKLLNT
jgi:hypothetical protein